MKTLLEDSWDCWGECMLAAEKNIRVIGPYLSAFPPAFWDSNLHREVYTCFDAQSFFSGSISVDMIQEILDQKITLYHVAKLHAKLLVVDDMLVHLGSQNFTTQGRHNREAGCEFSSEAPATWPEIQTFLGKLRRIRVSDLDRVRAWLEQHQDLRASMHDACKAFNPIPPLPKKAKPKTHAAAVSTGAGIVSTEKSVSVAFPVEQEEEPTADSDDVESVYEDDSQPPHDLPFTSSCYYERPLIMVLKAEGGCTRDLALREIRKIVTLVPGDFELYEKNGPKWEFLVSRARRTLLDLGYIDGRLSNWWRLTEAGLNLAICLGPYTYPSFLPGREPKPQEYFLGGPDFKNPLLRALIDLGGRASRRAVLNWVEMELSDRFQGGDFKIIQKKMPRWESIASATISRFKQKGIVSSPYEGCWEITQKGRNWLDSHQ